MPSLLPTDDAPQPISGGAHDSPWTQVFERRLVRFSPSDRRAFAEASLTVREVWHRARAVRALARQVRAR